MRRIERILTATGTALLIVGATWRSGEAQGAPPRPGVVASVGRLEVTREDLDRRYRQAQEEFRRRSGTAVPEQLAPVVRRQALEALIRANLLAQEAQRRGVPVTDAEAEEWIKKDPLFNQGGTFNATAFENARRNSPAEFQRAVRTAKMEIAARRLQEQLQKQSIGSEAALRSAAERALSRSPIDVLALPRAEFAGDIPEPTEAEVVAEYRAHATDIMQPARAVVSTVTVPGGATPAARARADSVLVRLRAGGTLEEAGTSWGGVRGDQVLLEGNFPGTWRVTDAQTRKLFRLRPGAVLDEPVATDSGWLLVRADQVTAAGPVPLSALAREVRQELRRERRREQEERRLRAQYESMRNELTRPARRVRYVAIAPGQIRTGEPTPADLDRYYRGHQADYTRYDAATGALLVRPFAEVKDEIRSRWAGERRELLARSLAGRVEEAWRKGTRDRQAEKEAGGAHERGPTVAGAPLDTTLAGRAVGDSLVSDPVVGAIGTVPTGAGYAVYHVFEVVPRFTPPFEQVLPELAARERDSQNDREAAAARAMFERDPARFAVGTAVFYSRILVPPPDAINVPLTRAEVERYYRDHFDRYAAAEQIRARHILVGLNGTGPEADRQARAKAEQLLGRARAGEDFAALARDHSDDVATRQDGGDLGFFARGTMLDEVERAAFAMRPGDVSEPIRTSEGYHLIRVIDHLPLQAEPLKLLYANVGWDCALEKAERISRRTADSLLQVVRTPAQARTAAAKLGLGIESGQHMVGDRIGTPQTQAIYERLERLKAGQFYPGIEMIKGQGAALQWVDSVGTPSLRNWSQGARHILSVYRREVGRQAVEAKTAELDSLLRAGWSADSVAALWGGWSRIPEYARGAGLEGYGGATELDSLVFGTTRGPAVEPGQLSGWVDLTDAAVRVRPGERGRPTQAQIAQRVESDRRLLVEYKMQDEFKAMKQRFPVRIHDDALRDVALPPLPPAPVL